VKFIRKGRKPPTLAKFERDNASTSHMLEYDALPRIVKRELSNRMLKEQGRLCAYTMRRIGANVVAEAPDFHIEHILSRSRRPELQLDYLNMILCAPGVDQPVCAWGARLKGNTEVGDSNFVSPLRADCEARFLYRLDGHLRATDDRDEAANSTIKILNLNHRELVEQRLAALRASGLGPGAIRPVGARAAARLSKEICLRSAEGDFAPFCVAIQQAAARLATKAAQRAARLRSAR